MSTRSVSGLKEGGGGKGEGEGDIIGREEGEMKMNDLKNKAWDLKEITNENGTFDYFH